MSRDRARADDAERGGRVPAPSGARARAKLNLYLEIVRKRSDGFHDLRTLFQTIDLADDVHVGLEATPGVRCVVEGAVLATDERNLAVAAAGAWLRATGSKGGASIRLVKRIPVGGGLGGGSSDAAAVLTSLEAQAGPSRATPPGTLLALARTLGADVPFLLEGGFAQATGRGDVLVALRRPPAVTYVLIVPPFGTDTGRVYERAHERLRPAPVDGLARAREAVYSGVPSRIRDAHHNDLAGPAMRAYPELLRFTSAAERLLGRAPCLTGSGSTLFDVPDPGELEDVVARLVTLPGRRLVVRGDSGPAVGA